MQEYQRKFIELSIRKGALRFGSFTLKSGRVSPYFFNIGLFDHGADLLELGTHYAQAIVTNGIEFDVLFGPAYKGIPLACATAMALASIHGRDVPWCFNRKEQKDHGEGGSIVGSPLVGDVLLVDDVITAGTAISESHSLISAKNAVLRSVLISLNRMERGTGSQSAIAEAEGKFGLKVYSIISFDDLLDYISDDPGLRDHAADMAAYRERYGV